MSSGASRTLVGCQPTAAKTPGNCSASLDGAGAALEVGADADDFGDASSLGALDDLGEFSHKVGVIEMCVSVVKSWHNNCRHGKSTFVVYADEGGEAMRDEKIQAPRVQAPEKQQAPKFKGRSALRLRDGRINCRKQSACNERGFH